MSRSRSVRGSATSASALRRRQVGEGTADPVDQVLPHLEERVERPDEHPADGDQAHVVLPDDGDLDRPVRHRSGVVEVQEERDGRCEQAPGQHPAAEVDARQLGSDDVADAQKRRAHLRAAHEQRALLDREQALPLRGDDLELGQDREEGAQPHPRQQETRAGLPLLPGLVDLGRRHRLGERQILVVDEDAAGDRDEHDAEDPAGDQDDRRDDVVTRREEGPPEARDEERGQREDGARRDVPADRADGPRAVLLEQSPAQALQDRHPDDGRRVGGGDRHPGLEAEVGVGRRHDHGHQHAQDQRARRRFPGVVTVHRAASCWGQVLNHHFRHKTDGSRPDPFRPTPFVRGQSTTRPAGADYTPCGFGGLPR